MAKKGYVALTCTKQTFTPVNSRMTRWWAKDDWREYYDATNTALGWGNPPHRKKAWLKLYEQGYRFCAVLSRGRAVAVAGLWPRTKEAWEVIAVGVRLGKMNRSLGRTIVSLVADEILKHGRKATITTRKGNAAMLRAAQAVGFKTTRQR